MGSYLPNQGLNLHPLQWEDKVLTTRLPGKSPAGWILAVYEDLGNVQASLVAQIVKNLPAMQEARAQTLGQEDLLEKGRATHFSILVWRIPWTKEAGRLYSPWGSQRCEHD